MLESGEVQTLPLVGRTPEREALFDFTFPYLSFQGAIVTRLGTNDIQEIKHLRNRHVAVMEGDNAEEYLRRADYGCIIHTTRTFEDALTELSLGRHDAVVIQRLLATHLIQKRGLTNLQIAKEPVKELEQDFCFAVKKGDSKMLSLLNEGLALVMADGTFSRMQAKWFASVRLPPENTIIVGTGQGYPPYSFIDDNGIQSGFNVDLTNAIAEVVGLNFKIVYKPWNEIHTGLQSGAIDVICGMYYSEERDEKVDFSPAYAIVHYAVFSKSNRADIRSVDDLKGRRVLVMRSDIMHDYAMKQSFSDQITVVDSYAEVIQLLSRGRYDYALLAELPGLYWIHKLGLKNIKISFPELYPQKYCYAVREDNIELLQHLNEGLAIVNESGEYRKIYSRWFGSLDPQTISMGVLLKYAAIILIPFLLLLAGSYAWSRSLQRQVAERTAALKQEIVERKQIESMLRESEESNRALVEGLPDIIMRFDRDARLLFISKKTSEVFDLSPDHGIGKTYRQLNFQVEICLFFEHAIQQVCESGNAYESEFSINGKQGLALFNWRFIAEFNSEGHTHSVLSIGRDITSVKKMQDSIQRSHKLESLGVLAGGIAHDFNNLLGGIFGFIDMAAETVREEHASQLLQKSLSTIDRARGLTRQLLTFAKGGVPVKNHHTLSPFLQETVLFRLSGSNCRCLFQIPDNLWECEFDKNQITQVIDNIVINAIESMPDGGTIEVDARNMTIKAIENQNLNAGEYVIVSIKDHGTGITKDILPRIFDPFYTTKVTGHGLGLSICYSIIKRHGGCIEIESESGRGSTFHLYLPASPSIKTAVIAQDALSLQHRGAATMIIMDDEETILEMTSTLLKSFGYHVVCTRTGKEAIDCFSSELKAKRPVSGLILDLTIPGAMGGKEAVKEIRKMDAEIAVFVSSGYAEDAVMANPAAFGFTASISKPFRKSQFAELLEKYLPSKQEIGARPCCFHLEDRELMLQSEKTGNPIDDI